MENEWALYHKVQLENIVQGQMTISLQIAKIIIYCCRD